MSLPMAYSIMKRQKMAKGGKACMHGGPAYCKGGCYDKGGDVEEPGSYEDEDGVAKPSVDSADVVTTQDEDVHGYDMKKDNQSMKMMARGGIIAPEAAKKAIAYEKSRDEMMNEAANKPRLEKPISMDSMDAEDEGDMKAEDEPMKMSKGGMMSGKRMVRMMMAKGGMVNSEDAMKAGLARTEAIENHSAGGMDNEDIDIYQTTPHDDNLSDEGEYPLMEEEGYEEGHQAKNRRKGGLLERVMAKIHSR